MTKRILILINVISFFFVMYFTFLAGLQTVVSAPRYDTDYQTLYLAFHGNNPNLLYAKFPYAPIVSVEEKSNEKGEKAEKIVKTLPVVLSVNVNTPVMSFLLHPFFNVSTTLLTNVIVWTAISLFGAALGIFILMMLFESKLSMIYFMPLLALFYLSWPSIYNLRLGEVSYLLLPIFCAFFFLEKKGFRLLAVILIALLSAMKLFFLIFILFYLFKKEWKYLLIYVVSFLVFFFAPIFYYSVDVYRAFFQTMDNAELIFQHAVFGANGSILGLIERVDRLWQFHLSYHYKKLILLLSAVILLGWYYFFDKKYIAKLSEFSDDIRIGFLTVFALMLSPLGWVYYYVFLLIPIVTFFKIQKKCQLSLAFYCFFCLAVFLPYVAWYYSATGWVFYIEQVAAFLSLFCWMLCLYCATRDFSVPCKKNPQNSILMISVLTAQVFFSFALLAVNFGIAFYLQWNKENYYRHTPAVMTMNPVINLNEKAE